MSGRGRPGPAAAAAAAVALVAALPALGVPFLSDDWASIAEATRGLPLRTPFADFRPLYMATFWAELRIAGLSAPCFHLTNILLLAGAASLLVVVLRRYTGDAVVALAGGVVFAAHPYHVESAAWVAARADPLCFLFAAAAALAYDRWRVEARGAPLAALVLFEAALLSKESGVVLPAFLLLVALVDRRRRPAAREWLRGHLPLAAVAAAHFFILRPWALGGPGRTLLRGLLRAGPEHALGFAAAALVPADVERIVARPLFWGAAALVALAGLALAAFAGGGAAALRMPLAAAAAFLVLLPPALVGFQERYLFIPGAAAAAAIAGLLRAARPPIAWALGALLAVGWGCGIATQWSGWFEAGTASSRLIADLARQGERPGARSVVVANMPFRVGGGSVAGDLTAALRLNGARPVEVIAATLISYPEARSDALDGPPGISVRPPPPYAEVWLRVPRRPFSALVAPPPSDVAGERLTPWGAIVTDGIGGVRVRIRPDADRGVIGCVWRDGGLRPLF